MCLPSALASGACPASAVVFCALRVCLSTVSCFNEFYACWAEAPIKIARMTLTIKLDRNWSSFQLANSAPPLSVTDSAIAPSARMLINRKRGRPWSDENINSEHAPQKKTKKKKKEHHSVSRRPFDHQTRSPKNCLEIRGERMNEHHHGDFVGLGCQV